MTEEAYIISTARTPIGSFGGVLSSFSATELGAKAIRGAIDKIKLDPIQVQEVFMGNVVSANLGQAPARQAALGAGLPNETICTTVNKVCASGMKAAAFATQAIRLGDADVLVAGGMESMSQIPFYLSKARYGYGYGNGELVDGLARDGLVDAYDHCAMGTCGDRTAMQREITREQQDEYAIRSYQRSAEANEKGYLKEEIVAVEVPQRKGEPLLVSEDEEFRKVNFEKIPTLRPVFSPEGTVTAANASTINDGGVAMILASGRKVKELNLKPLARVVAYADAEQEPVWFTTTPIAATRKVLTKAGMQLSDIDYFEVNEAFSVVVLAYMKELGLSPDKVNLFGGAVSLGHPLGVSGARIMGTLINVLHQKQGRYGLAAICNGGGGASAVILERM
ncbi:acetyl-CoA C-acyltransferase [Persicitalea jodogahamensis]|uniref:acetyl-CoA C-acetyltransferase n=1 Tax=Persicitalea jodogahamensis TaxID=402147 RepID=A0A8J3GA96_9BACT|nr:acetyl-CoA C-acyltransferase [Persicitalea jodogahamensis]GHB72513.1 acetyl-CoA acetyltransferase [Persicitalea jodogahamensis]